MLARSSATEYSVLESEQAAVDAIPTPTGRALAEQFFERAESRLALRTPDGEIYVARALFPEYVAVVLIDRESGAAVGACASMATIAARGALTVELGTGDQLTIGGLVPDGVVAVHVGSREATMGLNAFWCRGAGTAASITLISGSGVARVLGAGEVGR